MKILMTGFTSLQRGPERRGDIRKLDVPARIVEELRDRGHEVDWRPVRLGEAFHLDHYDAAWVNLARPISMNSRVGAFGAMWTLSEGIPCVGFYDDWQSPITVQHDFDIMHRRPNFVQKHIVDPKALREAAGLETATHLGRDSALEAVEAGRSVLREKGYTEKQVAELRAYRFYEEDYDIVEHYKPRLERLIEGMATGSRWAAGLVPVCPMYGWGDRSIVQRLIPEGSRPIMTVDPSDLAIEAVKGYFDRHDDAPVKTREWLLAALVAHDGWLKKQSFGWPVWNTGSRNMIKKMGQGERLYSEQDVVAAYDQRWGVLSPPYKEHAGSGWWRARFIYAASVGSVVSADPTEVSALGKAYSYMAEELEGMSDEDLHSVSDYQHAELARWLPEEGAVGQSAEDAIKAAIAGDRWQ